MVVVADAVDAVVFALLSSKRSMGGPAGPHKIWPGGMFPKSYKSERARILTICVVSMKHIRSKYILLKSGFERALLQQHEEQEEKNERRERLMQSGSCVSRVRLSILSKSWTLEADFSTASPRLPVSEA